MKTKFLMSAILVLTLTLAACAPKAVTATKQVPTPVAKTPTPSTSKATTAPTKAAGASPTTKANVSPTQKSASPSTPEASVYNDISIQDQAIKSDSVLVSLVDAMKPGWIVIYTDQNGQPGTVLGYAAVPAGISSDVKVKIDTTKETSKMIVMLHIDAGKIGTFEYPGPDIPAKNGTSNVMSAFNKKA